MENTRKFFGDAIIKFEDFEGIDNREPFKIEYYRTQNMPKGANVAKYGIEILKKKECDDNVILDKEVINNISSVEEDVNNILSILQRNKVTPISAGDVIEDLMFTNH